MDERGLTNGHHGSIGSEAQKFVEQRKFQCHKCRKTKRTPKPHVAPLQAPITAPEIANTRAPLPEPGLGISVPPLRSPTAHATPPHPPAVQDYREARPSSHAWPQHAPHTAAPPVQAPPLSQPPLMGQRPAPVSHGYPAAPPPRGSYNDWSRRPSSQHGSPPHHLNGAPPPLSNGPPMSSLSSLRPPAISGPPPAGQMSVGLQHPPPSQPWANGLPPSPRRTFGPAAPSPYPPFHPETGHRPPSHGPAHNHGLSNGGPPPPPRLDGFSHGLHPQRPYSGPHGSPPGSRNGLPPARDPPGPPGPMGPRNDNRPASGASASPSLRNLLS